MRANRFLTLFTLLFLSTMLLVVSSSKAMADLFSSSPEVSQLPAFSLPTLANTSKQLTNKTVQGHVSLLNVWASWCHFCHNEHDMLMKIKNTSSVPIYGILYRDNPEAARDYLQQNGNPYVAVGVDWSGKVASSLDVSGTPQTFIVDKHGRLREHYTGSLDNGRWHEIQSKIKQYESEN